MRGHFNSREVTARQPTRDRLANDELLNRTSVKLYKLIQELVKQSAKYQTMSVFISVKLFHYVFFILLSYIADSCSQKNRKKLYHTSQLSRINDFSIGHPPSSLNISQTAFESDSQSERSTSCKDWHCRTNVVKFSCFWRANRCNQNEYINGLIRKKNPTNGTTCNNKS